MFEITWRLRQLAEHLWRIADEGSALSPGNRRDLAIIARELVAITCEPAARLTGTAQPQEFAGAPAGTTPGESPERGPCVPALGPKTPRV